MKILHEWVDMTPGQQMAYMSHRFHPVDVRIKNGVLQFLAVVAQDD